MPKAEEALKNFTPTQGLSQQDQLKLVFSGLIAIILFKSWVAWSKFEKLMSLIIANERDREEYFCHFHTVSQAHNAKWSRVYEFSTDDKHFSLHTKFRFLGCYLKPPLNANCLFTLERKATPFVTGFKHAVPGGGDVLLALCSNYQTSCTSAHYTVQWELRSTKLLQKKAQISTFLEYGASSRDQLQFLSRQYKMTQYSGLQRHTHHIWKVLIRKHYHFCALLGKMKGKSTFTVNAERGEPLALVPLILSSSEAEKLMYSAPL